MAELAADDERQANDERQADEVLAGDSDPPPAETPAPPGSPGERAAAAEVPALADVSFPMGTTNQPLSRSHNGVRPAGPAPRPLARPRVVEAARIGGRDEYGR